LSISLIHSKKMFLFVRYFLPSVSAYESVTNNNLACGSALWKEKQNRTIF